MQKSYSIIAVAVAVILLYFVGSYISDNRATVNDTRKQLESLRESQQRIIGQLDNISSGLGKSIVRTEVIERTVESVADRNNDSAERIEESKRIISESQSILQDIRKQKQTVTN